ncbi:hypothetical protein BJ742DRAFT_910988 [Cladochytrium replicatum]|nr:hypothetical protein BJ742DRAFT_910988 [Cladochytrium replicatum]
MDSELDEKTKAGLRKKDEELAATQRQLEKAERQCKSLRERQEKTDVLYRSNLVDKEQIAQLRNAVVKLKKVCRSWEERCKRKDDQLLKLAKQVRVMELRIKSLEGEKHLYDQVIEMRQAITKLNEDINVREQGTSVTEANQPPALLMMDRTKWNPKLKKYLTSNRWLDAQQSGKALLDNEINKESVDIEIHHFEQQQQGEEATTSVSHEHQQQNSEISKLDNEVSKESTSCIFPEIETSTNALVQLATCHVKSEITQKDDEAGKKTKSGKSQQLGDLVTCSQEQSPFDKSDREKLLIMDIQKELETKASELQGDKLNLCNELEQSHQAYAMLEGVSNDIVDGFQHDISNLREENGHKNLAIVSQTEILEDLPTVDTAPEDLQIDAVSSPSTAISPTSDDFRAADSPIDLNFLDLSRSIGALSTADTPTSEPMDLEYK